jgi:two-component system sensor histidine kinase KdpD
VGLRVAARHNPTTHDLRPTTPARAWLRVYLGYAPGVGKTYAMLHEGQRRKARGTDAVVGWLEAYARPRTLEAIGDLEIVPARAIDYRGVIVGEMDIDAIVARRPQVALVDELAHTNVPGSRHAKRYQDVVELQANGINVISTVNIQHLASLNDTVSVLTGVTVRETLPDWIIDTADELEMVDQSPEALQKRLRRGNVYPKGQAAGALSNFFRTDNLTALRELTLRRMAQHAETRLLERSSNSSVTPSPAADEMVLVCVPPTEQAQQLVRRGVHLADRLQAALVVLHVAEPGIHIQAQSSRGYQEATRALQLARALGADVVTVAGADVADAVVRVADARSATQLVMGEARPSWVRDLLGRSVLRDVLRNARNVDVHIVQRAEA